MDAFAQQCPRRGNRWRGRWLDEIGRAGAGEVGMVALPHERPFGPASRVVQAAAIQLPDPVTATALCPLSMTDACAALLLRHDPDLARSWVDRLTARTGGWTARQWVTEKRGGSDVGRTATLAVKAGPGDGVDAETGRCWNTG